MTNGTYFVQDCPTCGRALHIRVESLGRALTCQHCRGKLRAEVPEEPGVIADPSLTLLRRADELLNNVRSA